MNVNKEYIICFTAQLSLIPSREETIQYNHLYVYFKSITVASTLNR